jgi:streptogramin lyase
VTPGTATLTLTATPVGSPATPFSQTMSLKLDHTAVFVSNGTNVLVFLDGNTASSATLPGTSSPRGVAVDAHGTVYVGNHTAPGSITECPESGAYLTCTTPITGPSFIEGVAIDPAGNLWISSNGSCVIEYPAGQTTANVTITTAFNTLRGVSVDTNNELWVADQSSSTIAGYAAPFTPTMTPFATLTSAAGVAAPIQVSSDASGNLWAAMCGASSCGGWGSGALQYAPPITSASAPAITLTGNGISAPEGVAIDAVASIWIASPTNGMVTHCLPPAGTLPCTSFAVPGALWIAAYPSDIDP